MTLKGLMIAIVVIGIGLAALVQPSILWAMILSFLLWTLSLTAILGILFRRGPRRAYWVGFALFAWAFLFLFWWSGLPGSPDPFPGDILNGWQAGRIELFMVPGQEPEKWGDIMVGLTAMVTEVTDENRIGVVASALGLAFVASEARLKAQDDGPRPGPGADEPPDAATSRG